MDQQQLLRISQVMQAMFNYAENLSKALLDGSDMTEAYTIEGARLGEAIMSVYPLGRDQFKTELEALRAYVGDQNTGGVF